MTDDTLRIHKEMERVTTHRNEQFLKGIMERKLSTFKQNTVAIRYSGFQTA
jgi:hypothetical protein